MENKEFVNNNNLKEEFDKLKKELFYETSHISNIDEVKKIDSYKVYNKKMKTEVICIKRSEVYEHHRKLKIGQKYLLQDNDDSIYIYTTDGESMGFYPRELFVTLKEWREMKLKELLK